MRIVDCRVIGAALTVAWAAQALSQELQERPVQWFVSGGGSITNGPTSTYLHDGWIFSGGVRFNPRAGGPFALDVEGHYSSYGATHDLVRLANQQQPTARIDSGWGDIWGLNANGVYKLQNLGWGSAYLSAGVGEYWRTVRLTQTVLLPGAYCDPWWGYCYSGVYPGQAIVQQETTGRFAWNAGLGFEFPLAYGSWFIDVRIHQMQTKKTTEFIPIQIGMRF
jgi:opacity protein-like surface antigen